VKDWALHKRMCAASGSDRSVQPTVSTSRSTAQVINAVASTSVALATHDDAARSGVVRATAAMVVDLPPKAGVTSTSATVATRKSQIGAQAEPSENKLVLSCCCHVSESGEGHHFHGVSVCGIRINLEQASAISITEYRFPATTIPALQKQCAEVLDTIFGLARNTDTPTTIAAQLLEKYIELKRMSNTMELMHAREVDSTLDGVMNIIKECRICHLGNPCWELLQYYVNIFLGERIRYDREFRDRLRVRVSDTEQILAAFCHKPMADELCARMSTDIAKLKVFLTPTAAEAEMQAIMTTVAQVECNTAAVQISLAKSMKAIEHGGDDNSEIISRRSEIIKMESELAEKFEKRIGDWVDLQYAELQKADGDAMLLIALCFATKALMARAMLLRGHKHPPVPSSAVSDVAERTTLKLKRCADDFADARAHYAAGEYAESIEGFDRCTKMLPSFYTCWYLLGNARRATGGDYGYRQSVNAYRMVLHGSSQNATVHCSLGASLGVRLLYHSFQSKLALPTTKHSRPPSFALTHTSPTRILTALLYFFLASCIPGELQQVGMWAEAIKSYDDAISLDPSCGVYQRRRSYAQRKLESTNDARQGLSVGSTSIGASKQHASQSSEKRMLAGQPQSEPTFLADAQVTEIFIGAPAPTAHRKRKRKKGSGVVGRPPKAKRETTVVQSAPHLSDTVLPEIHVELEVEEHKGSEDSPGMLPSPMEVSEGGHPKRSEGPGRPSSYPLEQPEGPPAEEVDEEVDGLLFFSSKV
jgi:tetratricopeptide (TPR) repeat protein